MKEMIVFALIMGNLIYMFMIAWHTTMLRKKINGEQFNGFWLDVMWSILIAGGIYGFLTS
ncbi:MAG: hypothetical protein KF852_04520 [Saprospiraceae bacterium]|nr:hypothetical protein [Saprospiraceae bacterium]